MTPEINYKTEGFVHDTAYTAHLKKIIENYQNDFAPLKKVDIVIREKTFQQLEDNDNDAKIVFSKDGESCDITIYVWHNYNNKGHINSTPTPHEVFETVNDVIQRAVNELDLRKQQ